MEPGIQPGRQEPIKKPTPDAPEETSAGITRPQATPEDARAMKEKFPGQRFKAAEKAQAAQDTDQIAAVKDEMGLAEDYKKRKPDETTTQYKERLTRHHLETKYQVPARKDVVPQMQAGEVLSAKKQPGEKVEPVESMQDKVNQLMEEYNNLRTKMSKLEGKGFAFFKKTRLKRLQQMESNLNVQVLKLTETMEDTRNARTRYDQGAGYYERATKEARADVGQRTADYMEQIGPAVEARRESEAEKSLADAAQAREEEMAAYRPITDVEKSVKEETPTEEVEVKAEEIEELPASAIEELRPTQEELRTAADVREVEDMGEVEAGDDEPTDEEIAAQMAEIIAELPAKERARDLAAEKAGDQYIGLEYQVTSPQGADRFQENMIYWGTLGDEYGELADKKVYVRNKKDLDKSVAELEESGDYQMVGRGWDTREVVDEAGDTLEFGAEEIDLDEDEEDENVAKTA